MIYLENLCTYEEFKNMSLAERQQYIDEIYGCPEPHEIVAEITAIHSTVMYIHAEFFFFSNEGLVVKFQVCKNKALDEIGASGYLDNLGRERVQDFCDENNFRVGDKISCQIVLQRDARQNERGNYLTFYIRSLSPFPYQNIGDVYQKYNLTYEPGRLYELRRDSTEELEIFVCKDINERFRHILSEGADSIEAQNAEISTLENQAHDISDKIKNLEAEYAEKLRQQEADLAAARQEKLAETEREKSALEQEISRRRSELAYLENFGISLEPPAEIKNYADEDLIEFENFFSMIRYWQDFLYHGAEHLYYDFDILGSLYMGLQTDQLILLAGNPGTGKTSLARNLAKSFGFEDTAIIPVQSNWTDKSDLLGYYNPLDKTYVATPFLDALLDFCEKARTQPPEKLFIICLDEMNLAHIENYFAEFLSKLQDDRRIYLYSENLRRDMEAELKAYGKQDVSTLTSSELEYHFKLQRMANMLAKYPASFYIPPNIKFIGTLNQDETTFDLSPKVLDRSYVIRLEMCDDDFAPITNDGDFTKPIRHIFLENYRPDDSYETYNYVSPFDKEDALSNFGISEEEFEPEDCNERRIKDFVKEMHHFANISNRVSKKIIITKKFSDWMNNSTFIQDGLYCMVMMYAVCAFLLPKIRWEGDEYKSKIDALKGFCRKYLDSEKIFEQIDSGEDIDFWRR